jgi:electron transfer flavoprotein beta subunit
MKPGEAFGRPLRIVVPVKQVPESGNVKMDSETGTVIRAGVETVVNPLDLYALETGLRIKEKYGAEITALSMGPAQAMRVLREAVAMGCDNAALISDRRFSGSDTLATSYTIAQAVLKTGNADLIIAGERATDGDTAQVGPGIAAWLDIPAVTYVSKINGLTCDASGRRFTIKLERLVEEGREQVSASLPCLITVVKEIGAPRLPTLKGKIRSKEINIPVFDAESMNLNSELLGLSGSPTRVVKIDTPRITRGGRLIKVRDDDSLNYAVGELLSLLENMGLLAGAPHE